MSDESVAQQRARDDAWRTVDPVDLLRAVVAAGLERGTWKTTTAFSLDVLVTDPRKVRSWLAWKGTDRSPEALGMREAVLDRLVNLAEQLGIDPWLLLAS